VAENRQKDNTGEGAMHRQKQHPRNQFTNEAKKKTQSKGGWVSRKKLKVRERVCVAKEGKRRIGEGCKEEQYQQQTGKEGSRENPAIGRSAAIRRSVKKKATYTPDGGKQRLRGGYG